MMESKIISPTDERWLTFINAHPSAMLFHHPAWIQFLADCYHYQPFVLAMLDSSSQITAGIPFLEINRAIGGKRLVALPFTDHCTPLYTADSLDPLAKSVSSLYTVSKAKEMELRWNNPSLPKGHTDAGQVLHTLNLEADASRVLARFKPAHRRNLQTAQNSGLQVTCGTDENTLQQFYRLHLETRQRQGVPIQPWSFFRLMGKKLLEPGYGFVLLAHINNECIAASIFLGWKNTLIYKFGASTQKGQPYRPNNMLMWRAIQWGCENGYTIFDFGRTDIKNEGLRRFKAGFGAQEAPLFYWIMSKQQVGIETPRLLKILGYVIQHSPAWVCRSIGEVLYKFAG